MKESQHYDYEVNEIELLDKLHLQFALYNYNKFKKALRGLEERIKLIQDQKLQLPSGIVVKREVLNSNKPNRLLELMEKQQILLSKYRDYEYYVELVDDFVKGISEPDKSLIIDRYYNSMSWALLEEKYNFSERQMSRIIKRNIKTYNSINNSQ